jgi:hypothetical protein
MSTKPLRTRDVRVRLSLYGSLRGTVMSGIRT